MPSRGPKQSVPPLPQDGKANLKWLSEHLGLSRTTISLVLNDAPLAKRLSAETRERVIRAAENFGYRPNYFARSLTSKRSFLIGILAPDFGDGYDAAVLSGIESRLRDSEYVYFVASHLWSPSLLGRSVDTLLDRGAEGLLLVNTVLPRSVSVPTVTIGSNAPAGDASVVQIDNAHGVHLAVEHLAKLGHRKIAFFKGHRGSADTEERWRGVQRSCQEFGMEVDPSLTVELERMGEAGVHGIDEGHAAARKLLERRTKFTALLAFNDMSAIGAMNAFRDAGLSVPADVSIVGFDDLNVSAVVYPPLTTVRQPLREMGERAADKILRHIGQAGEPTENISLEPGFIVRASTAALGKKARRQELAQAAN